MLIISCTGDILYICLSRLDFIQRYALERMLGRFYLNYGSYELRAYPGFQEFALIHQEPDVGLDLFVGYHHIAVL